MSVTIPVDFHKFFWDTNIENIDVQQNAAYVIDRLLMTGDLDSWRWLQTTYNTHHIKQRILQSRQLSKKDAVFFSTIYGIPLADMRCNHKA